MRGLIDLFVDQSSDGVSRWLSCFDFAGCTKTLHISGDLGDGTLTFETAFVDNEDDLASVLDDNLEVITLTTTGSILLDMVYGLKLRVILSGSSGADLTVRGG